MPPPHRRYTVILEPFWALLGPFWVIFGQFVKIGASLEVQMGSGIVARHVIIVSCLTRIVLIPHMPPQLKTKKSQKIPTFYTDGRCTPQNSFGQNDLIFGQKSNFFLCHQSTLQDGSFGICAHWMLASIWRGIKIPIKIPPYFLYRWKVYPSKLTWPK